MLEQKFKDTSVADLLDTSGDHKPLCRFPAAPEVVVAATVEATAESSEVAAE